MKSFFAVQSLPATQASRQLRVFGRVAQSFDAALAAATATLAVWRRRHRDRQHLANLDSRMLRDIGVSHADVAHEAAKPFWRM